MPSSILKTLQSPKTGEGFPPLTPPRAPAQLVPGQLGISYGLLLLLHVPSNVQYLLFFFIGNHMTCYENHRFHYVGRAKWTLKIIDFHTFSQSLKPLENIENQNCSFFIKFSTVLSSLDFLLNSFLSFTFHQKHDKYTLAKTHAFPKVSILSTKYQQFRVLKSLLKYIHFFLKS